MIDTFQYSSHQSQTCLCKNIHIRHKSTSPSSCLYIILIYRMVFFSNEYCTTFDHWLLISSLVMLQTLISVRIYEWLKLHTFIVFRVIHMILDIFCNYVCKRMLLGLNNDACWQVYNFRLLHANTSEYFLNLSLIYHLIIVSSRVMSRLIYWKVTKPKLIQSSKFLFSTILKNIQNEQKSLSNEDIKARKNLHFFNVKLNQSTYFFRIKLKSSNSNELISASKNTLINKMEYQFVIWELLFHIFIITNIKSVKFAHLGFLNSHP